MHLICLALKWPQFPWRNAPRGPSLSPHRQSLLNYKSTFNSTYSSWLWTVGENWLGFQADSHLGRVSEKRWELVRVSSWFSPWIFQSIIKDLFETHLLVFTEFKIVYLKPFFLFFLYPICLLFIILHPVGTRESIRWKVDHGGQIVLWYEQHATNLVRATMFVVCMSSTRMIVWVKGRVEQMRSLTFYVFVQARSKCSSSSTFPKSPPQQSLLTYGTPFHAPSTTSSCVLPHRNRAIAFRSWTQLMSHK